MPRQLNVRFLIALLGSAALLGLVTHLIHGWQVRRDADFLLRQADRARDEKHLDKEVEYLRRFLLVKPAEADVRARLGFALEARARTSKELLLAFMTLEQALRER